MVSIEGQAPFSGLGRWTSASLFKSACFETSQILICSLRAALRVMPTRTLVPRLHPGSSHLGNNARFLPSTCCFAKCDAGRKARAPVSGQCLPVESMLSQRSRRKLLLQMVGLSMYCSCIFTYAKDY